MRVGRVLVSWDVRWLSAGAATANATVEQGVVTLAFETPQEIGTLNALFSFEPQFRKGTAIHGRITELTRSERRLWFIRLASNLPDLPVRGTHF